MDYERVKAHQSSPYATAFPPSLDLSDRWLAGGTFETRPALRRDTTDRNTFERVTEWAGMAD